MLQSFMIQGASGALIQGVSKVWVRRWLGGDWTPEPKPNRVVSVPKPNHAGLKPKPNQTATAKYHMSNYVNCLLASYFDW